MSYTEGFKIPYYETNIKGLATPESLLAYMGEVATLHSDNVGLNIENLRKNNYGWMLHRWKVKINDFPLARDFIYVKTWPSNFRKFYANREFKILDKNEKELVNASSIWIFLDMKKKRPIRVTEEITNLYDVKNDMLFDDFYDFNMDFDTEGALEFRVRKADIDYNNHVNNVKYFQWMLETLPEYIDYGYILKEFEILYKKEVGLGSLVKSSYCVNFDEGQVTILHKVEEKSEIMAYGRTTWKKRP